jgi:PAS domain S-box-containing protein
MNTPAKATHVDAPAPDGESLERGGQRASPDITPRPGPVITSRPGAEAAGTPDRTRSNRRVVVGAELLHPPTFMELSAQLFCIVDFTSAVTWCNAAFERSLGFGRGELSGLKLSDLLHADDAGVLDSARMSVLATGEVGLNQVRFRTRDGSWRWLEWTTRVDFGRGRVYAAARDITERRAREIAVRDSEALLNAIIHHSPSAIFVKDLEGRYVLVNEVFSSGTGIARPQVEGKSTHEVWHLPTAAEIRASERQLLAQGSAVAKEERMLTADGPRDFIVNRFVIPDEGGNPYAIGGIATDITERLRAEAALTTRERLLDSVIRASPDMITLLDREGVIHQISENTRAMFGHPPDVFGRSHLFDFVHPDDRDEVAASFIRMVTGAVAHMDLRYRLRHADGHWVTVDSRGRGVLDEDGHFAAAVVVSRDITAELETERRLRALREAAENASRAKSEFLSRMSHELRTPLNSILGFAQLLQMDELSVEQSDAVEHILRAGRHLLDLIDEVLDIARIETGHLELVIEPVVVGDILTEAIDLTNPMAARAEVTVCNAVDLRSAPVVIADRQRLMQVSLNILSNAVKYNRPGGRVDVSCHQHPPGWRISIADTGRGIHPEDLERVFAPFDRLGAEHTGVEGTGVGLALSRHLVEQMGGRLEVVSVPEVGSTFFVDLPAATAAVVVDHRPRVQSGADEVPRRVGATRPTPSGPDPDVIPAIRPDFRVVLIEENLATLDLVERVLSRRPGTEVIPAMQGRLGVDLVREHRPDMILLDLHLPDMDGSAVLDLLGDDPATARIPVAVVGADAPTHTVRQLLGRGVIGFLAKPIDVRGLLSLVDAVRAARGA